VLIAAPIPEFVERLHPRIVITDPCEFVIVTRSFAVPLGVERRQLSRTTFAGAANPDTSRAGSSSAGLIVQLFNVTLVVKKTVFTTTSPITLTLLIVIAFVSAPDVVKTIVPLITVDPPFTT
jgi:hypothetical protein